MTRRHPHLRLLTWALLLGNIQAVQADEITFFSRTYTREAGKPAEWQESITIPAGVAAPFRLVVQNGLPDGSARVGSATIDLGQLAVVKPQDLNQTIGSLERPLDLADDAVELRVRLTSKVGGQLSIQLVGLKVAQGPAPPEKVDAFAEMNTAEVGWSPSPDEGVAEYRLYRGPSPTQMVLVGAVPADQRTGDGYMLLDHGFRGGAPVFYAVSAVDQSGQEGARSSPHAEFVRDPNAPRGYPKLGDFLNTVHELSLAGGDIFEAAKDLGIAAEQAPPYRLGINIFVDRDDIPSSYLQTLQQLGVVIDFTARNMISGRVSVDRLPALAQLSFVRAVAAQESHLFKHQSMADVAEVPDAIIKLIGADAMQNVGLNGQLIDVAVIDAFTDDDHGDLVTDIVAQVATGAVSSPFDLTRRINGQQRFHAQALQQEIHNAVNSGADVVNLSVGFGPSANYALIAENEMTGGRAVGVVSASNDAKLHVVVPMQDDDNNDWVDFAFAGNTTLNQVKLLGVRNADVTMYAYSPDPVADTHQILEFEVCGLVNCQSSQSNRTEVLSWVDFQSIWTDEYRIRVKMGQSDPITGQNPNEGRTLHLLTSAEHVPDDAKLSVQTPSRSITGLAAAPSLLTVGASVRTKPGAGDDVAEYSCQGVADLPAPLAFSLGFSHKGILKPDLVAPGEYSGLKGTSFAAPLVSAAAAILLQEYRQKNTGATRNSPGETDFIRKGLRTLAVDLKPGQPSPHPAYGYGRLSLKGHGLLAGDRFEIYRIWVRLFFGEVLE